MHKNEPNKMHISTGDAETHLIYLGKQIGIFTKFVKSGVFLQKLLNLQLEIHQRNEKLSFLWNFPHRIKKLLFNLGGVIVNPPLPEERWGWGWEPNEFYEHKFLEMHFMDN